MLRSEYFENIKKKYARYFDIKEGEVIHNQSIDIFARFNEVSSRTVITKNDVVDSFETNEYCFLKGYESIELEDITNFCEFLKKASEKFVMPHKNHMSSYITGVMICDKKTYDEVRSYAKKFKHKKAYKMFLFGWSEVRLVIVELESGAITTNSAGKRVYKVYQLTP